ncbi:hypothetical protein Vadar_026801 [Vaccinium darrowii]|uniref:Uncharacterized protein n=1 Tax=Vaccinium darrowii TaxID=229202 RepID=A0ACB7Y3J9_9ERIC|nr:hypothetical protein Vadar_026801 [Vaccinium darrowii]
MATKTSAATAWRILYTLVIIGSLIPVFVSGYNLIDTIILFVHGDPDCTHPHLERDLGFAIFAFVLFLIGVIGVVARVDVIQAICMIVLLITVVLLLAVTMIITAGPQELFGLNHSDDGKKIVSVFRLEKYPRWAKNFILNDKDWGVFQACVVREKFCEKLDIDALFQEGCCSPPVYCGYQDINKTWVVPKSGLYHEDNNCVNWSNDDNKRCYHCNACKAAYINNYVYEWALRGAFMFITLVIWFGCLTFTFDIDDENNKREDNKLCSP